MIDSISLSAQERSAAVEELETSRRRLLAGLEGLTEEQWRARPAPDGWSIAECAEHITAAEIPIPKLLKSSIAVDPPPEERSKIRHKDDFVRTVLRDRSRQAPSEGALPYERGNDPDLSRETERQPRLFAHDVRCIAGLVRPAPLRRDHRWLPVDPVPRRAHRPARGADRRDAVEAWRRLG